MKNIWYHISEFAMYSQRLFYMRIAMFVYFNDFYQVLKVGSVFFYEDRNEFFYDSLLDELLCYFHSDYGRAGEYFPTMCNIFSSSGKAIKVAYSSRSTSC